MLERIAGLWFTVLAASAAAAAALGLRLSTRRRVRIVDEGERGLAIGAGQAAGGPGGARIPAAGTEGEARGPGSLRRARVTVDLDPRRFVFRTIEVPARATDYLEPIVRTQIDRLTPWRSEAVMFGWSEPVPQGTDGNVAVAVAATDRTLVTPILDRVRSLGAAEIVARVALPADLQPGGQDTGATVVVARLTGLGLSVGAWRRIIGTATAIVVVLVIASSLYGQVAFLQLGAEAEDLARDGAAKRARLARALSEADPAAGSRLFVERRKAEAPFATLVLEAVTRLLPDNSYVTSFDMTGTRLQLVGFTSDAPALIRLFEGSDLFNGASFFAPTTRLANDPADRFSIEAAIRPEAFVR